MEAISAFDIFKIGVGPSSSHTLGPWRAAGLFLSSCREHGVFDRIDRLQIDLYGSLAKTGRGHGTDQALILGLIGEDPETCDTLRIPETIASIARVRRVALSGTREIAFDPSVDILFNRNVTLPFHPNGLRFTAFQGAESLDQQTFYSIGGGFVIQEGQTGATACVTLPLPIDTAEELLQHCGRHGLTVPEVVRVNERIWRTDAQIRDGLRRIQVTMQECVYRGCHAEGTLPGGLNVVRRAAGIHRSLVGEERIADVDAWIAAIRRRGGDFQDILKWISCFALAVNEENAAFGRVVTAPTNGAAGVIPAVMMHYLCFCDQKDPDVESFLLTAAEIGSLFKKGATISAAMGGCQAEIGVSSAMAASALTHCLGGSVEQVLMAAEIAMEHHLGLTCDPVGGLVQIPCIERNSMGAVKAITASSIALASDPARARVSLDAVIRSMWRTALDMSAKYKETAEGGLALQIPVSVSEC